jgi:hypothetical protein
MLDDMDLVIAEMEEKGTSRGKGIGTSWAMDQRHAVVYEHGAYDNALKCGIGTSWKEYILVSIIKKEDVDVLNTFLNYVIWEQSNKTEDEVVLKENTRIILQKIMEKKTGKIYKVDAVIKV